MTTSDITKAAADGLIGPRCYVSGPVDDIVNTLPVVEALREAGWEACLERFQDIGIEEDGNNYARISFYDGDTDTYGFTTVAKEIVFGSPDLAVEVIKQTFTEIRDGGPEWP